MEFRFQSTLPQLLWIQMLVPQLWVLAVSGDSPMTRGARCPTYNCPAGQSNPFMPLLVASSFYTFLDFWDRPFRESLIFSVASQVSRFIFYEPWHWLIWRKWNHSKSVWVADIFLPIPKETGILSDLPTSLLFLSIRVDMNIIRSHFSQTF